MPERRPPSLAELRRIVARVDLQLADMGHETSETKRLIAAIGRQVGELTNGWGRFVEALVLPAIPVRFAKLGYDVYAYGSQKRRQGSEEIEVDVLALARHRTRGEVALVVEVKSHLTIAAVDEVLEKKLPKFFDFFTEYRDRTVEGVVAGIRVDEGVDRYAQEKGLYVLIPSGDTVRIANPKRFEPRAFRAR